MLISSICIIRFPNICFSRPGRGPRVGHPRVFAAAARGPDGGNPHAAVSQARGRPQPPPCERAAEHPAGELAHLPLRRCDSDLCTRPLNLSWCSAPVPVKLRLDVTGRGWW